MKQTFLILLSAVVIAAMTSCNESPKIKTATQKKYYAAEKDGEIVPEDPNEQDILIFKYDSCGKIVQRINGDTYTYDTMHDTTYYTYNNEGLLDSVYIGEAYEKFIYDSNNKLTKILYNDGFVLHTYNDNEQLTEIKYISDGECYSVEKVKYSGDTVIHYTYSADGKELENTARYLGSKQLEHFLSGEYTDKNGKKIKSYTKWEGELPIETENTYIYDTADGFTIINTDYLTGKVFFEYEFDEHKNWIKRIEFYEKSGEKKPNRITYREIEYY